MVDFAVGLSCQPVVDGGFAVDPLLPEVRILATTNRPSPVRISPRWPPHAQCGVWAGKTHYKLWQPLIIF